MLKIQQVKKIMGLLALLGGGFNLSFSAHALTFVVPTKPWEPVVISQSRPEQTKESENTVLRSPTMQISEREEAPASKKPLKATKRTEDLPLFSGENSFVSIGAMAISGRISKPSLPFSVERVQGKRTFYLPRLSPVEAIRSSASQIK
jgi:hypothetical protein